jgi:hypothetical protein
MDTMIARYIELTEDSKEIRKKLGMMNREKRVLEEKIQESLKATGQTEIISNDETICIRLKEKTRKRGPTRDEMIENIAEATGYFMDSEKLEGLKKETKVMNLQVLNKRPARG